MGRSFSADKYTLLKIRFSLLSRLCFVILLFSFQTTHAAILENLLTANPKASALGNAVSADYVGIDSLQYNPASLIDLDEGFSTDFKALGAPLLSFVRQINPVLTPRSPTSGLFFRGYTVRCDSGFRPFSSHTPADSVLNSPGRDPVTGGIDPGALNIRTDIPADACFGPELVNPNGVFLNDPLDTPPSSIERTIPIPLAAPFYLPNIGFKASEDSRLAFAAQIFTNAPTPTVETNVDELLTDFGIRRFTATAGAAYQLTDKLRVGGAMRITQAELDIGFGVNGESQVLGLFNSLVNDLCTTNETGVNANANSPEGGAQLTFDALGCADLYRQHQVRVDNGEARDSGYWPFIPWEALINVQLSGRTEPIYSWNFGVQWQPASWITWGATYRTKENDIYKTSGRVFYSNGLLAIINGLQSNPVLGAVSSLLIDGSASDAISVDINVPFPRGYSSGVRLQLLDTTNLNIEYRKYFYSDWAEWTGVIRDSEINILRLIGSTEIPIDGGGRDVSYYALGLEHQWNQRLAFRFGYEDRPGFDESGLFPIFGLRIVSLGSEYRVSKDKTLDISLSSMLLDGTRSTAPVSPEEDPLIALSARGTEYPITQLDINVVMFLAKFTHRF